MLIAGETFDADQARAAGAFDYIVCGAGSAGCAAIPADDSVK
jgi:hypothetical protein